MKQLEFKIGDFEREKETLNEALDELKQIEFMKVIFVVLTTVQEDEIRSLKR